MSLPPVTVQIKRKATDEPVDFLRVHEANSKRQRRATDFVFSRRLEADNSSTVPPWSTADGVRRIKQITRSTSSQSLGAQSRASKIPLQYAGQLGVETEEINRVIRSTPTQPNNIPQTSLSKDAPQSPLQVTQPRRFHISRSAAPPIPLGTAWRPQKHTTIFMERRARPRASQEGNLEPTTPGPTPEPEQVRPPQKKPGLAARTSVPSKENSKPPSTPAPPPRNVRLPSGLVMPWNVKDEQLAAEMQAYTLQEIGYSIAESEATKPGGTAIVTPRKRTPSRFKPKKPALRYRERHPEEFADDSNGMDIDEPFEQVEDDSEYIIDTYIRMPAHALESIMQVNIGLLVLDSQPDIDEFYRVESESEDDEEDEEDENAENHYSADYPDEEVESDDEYDRNPYLYRNHNAEGSDREDYGDDDDDATYSDDGNDATKYPWAKKPSWMRKPMAAHDIDEESEGKERV